MKVWETLRILGDSRCGLLCFCCLTIIAALIFLVDYEPAMALPVVSDPNLKAEVYFEGIRFPTSMAFLGPDDILVLEKDSGKVRRIVNAIMLDEPLLQVNSSSANFEMEQGLLGIALSKNNAINGSKEQEPVFVFLYYTEFEKQSDLGENTEEEAVSRNNRLYRYELVDNKLVNPKLLYEFSDIPQRSVNHNGGVISVGPDSNIYLAVGDLEGYKSTDTETKAQNFENGTAPDGRAGILRFTQEGEPVGNGILGDTYPLNLYYAYGIRNSFGMDFDPVTGNLWDTENGPVFGDEINLVEPGFNSGWQKIQGLNKVDPNNVRGPPSSKELHPTNLVDFSGKGKYSAPEFIWNYTLGPSAIKFLDSDKLGRQYRNDVFVGEVNGKRIFHFDLNENRTELKLEGPLEDKIAESKEELENVIFASGFGRITDVEVGYDGLLYVISYKSDGEDPFQSEGTIHRIVPVQKNR